MRRVDTIKGPTALIPAGKGEFTFSGGVRGFAVGLLAGCIVYFSVPFEFRLVLILTSTPFLLLPFLIRNTVLLSLLVLATGFLCGAVVSQNRIAGGGCGEAFAPGQRVVTGWVEAIDRSSSGRERLYVRPHGSHCRIRIVARSGDIAPGEAITVRARLFSPAAAAVPGAYDSRLPLYFRRIVLTGYAIGAVEPALDPGLMNGETVPGRGLVIQRAAISDRIRAALPGRNGAIAAALLTGDRGHIDRDDAETLRASGLGHILAISGLHMGLVAGGIFFAVRLLSALILPWSRRGNTAAPAAIAGLIAGLCYLFISGAAIPTQRAFIMTSALLLAALVGRRAFSIHTLALALIAVLLFQPESAVSPGFQMSFAAAGALIAAAEYWRENSQGRWIRSGPLAVFAGLGMTSLIAGSATSPFAAFHFHRLARYGLIANLAAMPVFTFIVMPSGLLALALMPLGWEGLPLWFMSKGLDLVFWSAETVTGWPGALIPVAAAPGWVLALLCAGLLLLLLMRRFWRWAGLPVMATALIVWTSQGAPDLYISAEGDMLASRPGAEAGWQSPDRQGPSFGLRVFMERYGGDAAPAESCDQSGCVFTIRGNAIAWNESGDGLDEDCERSALIITPQSIPYWIARECRARIIDAQLMTRYGAHLIWLRPAATDEDASRAEREIIARMRRVEDNPRIDGRPWQGEERQ